MNPEINNWKLSRKLNIGIVNYPGVAKSPNIIPLANFLSILNEISDNIYVILGKNEYLNQKENYPQLHFSLIENFDYLTLPLRLVNYGNIQLKIAIKLLIIGRRVDIWIFFIGGDTLVLPVFMPRILRKKVLTVIAGSSVKTLESKKDPLYRGLRILQLITCMFANEIVLYSQKLINDYDLKIWQKKILIAHEHFLDFTTFTVTARYHDRPLLIGYIGRFSAEKGIQHFVQALPAILNEKQDLRALIGGDGQLMDSVKASLDSEKIVERVYLPGWISHDDLPKYLNQLRLLVLPSYTEGLPNIILEAMACGTPVLTTPVGAIPDIIQDGKTGFIMENNSPESIVKNVIRVLSSPELEKIADNSLQYVKENYTFESTVNRWRKLLEEIRN